MAGRRVCLDVLAFSGHRPHPREPHAYASQAYCQLQTSKGNVNVEIHCDIVPRMAENFIGLCAKGYYDGTKFHRSIKNFMVQVRARVTVRIPCKLKDSHSFALIAVISRRSIRGQSDNIPVLRQPSLLMIL